MERQSGFTIIGVIIALAIIAGLAALGTPSIMRFSQNAKLSSAIREMRNNLDASRVKAARDMTQVSFVFTSYGYLIFFDQNENGLQDSGDQTLLDYSYPGGISVDGNNFTLLNGNGQAYTGFDTRGLLIRNSQGNIQLKNGNNQTRKVTVGILGQIKLG